MKDKKSTARRLRPIMFFLQIGWMTASPVLLLTFFGWWLDGRWGISPWLTIVGCVLGLLTGALNFYKLAVVMYADVAEDEEDTAYRKAYRTTDGRALPPDELILPGDRPSDERSRLPSDRDPADRKDGADEPSDPDETAPTDTDGKPDGKPD